MRLETNHYLLVLQEPHNGQGAHGAPARSGPPSRRRRFGASAVALAEAEAGPGAPASDEPGFGAEPRLITSRKSAGASTGRRQIRRAACAGSTGRDAGATSRSDP